MGKLIITFKENDEFYLSLSFKGKEYKSENLTKDDIVKLPNNISNEVQKAKEDFSL